MLTIGVTTLDHEVLDDAMDEQGVVDAHLRDLQEVVTRLWCLVVESDTDITCCGLKQHLSILGLRPGR